MGQKALAVVMAIIVGICSLGFAIWLGLAVLVMTVGQPNEAELDVLLAVALAVAIGLGVWVRRLIASRA